MEVTADSTMLRAAMRAIEAEATGQASPTCVPTSLRFAALAGLGSKYLAIGSPISLGLIECSDAEAIVACHELLFGNLEIRCATRSRSSLEETMACDIVCLPSNAPIERVWIADATHVNLLDVGVCSPGVIELLQDATIVTYGPSVLAPASPHGSLADVVTGPVSGRMGEELTGLLCATQTES